MASRSRRRRRYRTVPCLCCSRAPTACLSGNRMPHPPRRASAAPSSGSHSSADRDERPSASGRCAAVRCHESADTPAQPPYDDPDSFKGLFILATSTLRAAQAHRRWRKLLRFLWRVHAKLDVSRMTTSTCSYKPKYPRSLGFIVFQEKLLTGARLLLHALPVVSETSVDDL